MFISSVFVRPLVDIIYTHQTYQYVELKLKSIQNDGVQNLFENKLKPKSC